MHWRRGKASTLMLPHGDTFQKSEGLWENLCFSLEPPLLDTRFSALASSFVLCYAQTTPLDSETVWTKEFWLNTIFLKREAANAIHRAKVLQLFSLHPINQKGSSCCHNFLTVIQSYHSQVTHIGALHSEKIAESLLFYVSTITYFASS